MTTVTQHDRPAQLLQDLQPAPAEMTAERYAQIVLLAQKYYGEPASTALRSAEDDMLRILFSGSATKDDLAIWHELRMAKQIAVIAGRLRDHIMPTARNSLLFDAAYEMARLEQYADTHNV